MTQLNELQLALSLAGDKLSLLLFEDFLPVCTSHELEVYTAVTADITPKFHELLHKTNPRTLRLYFRVGESHGELPQCAPQLWEPAPRLASRIMNFVDPFSPALQVSRNIIPLSSLSLT